MHIQLCTNTNTDKCINLDHHNIEETWIYVEARKQKSNTEYEKHQTDREFYHQNETNYSNLN